MIIIDIDRFDLMFMFCRYCMCMGEVVCSMVLFSGVGVFVCGLRMGLSGMVVVWVLVVRCSRCWV